MVPSILWPGAMHPVYAPLANPEDLAAIDKAEARTATRARPRVARRPVTCKLTYAFNETKRRDVPRLRLEGKWMEPLGFAPGGLVTIEVREDAGTRAEAFA